MAASTHQMEKLEEVCVGVQRVLDLLQVLLGKGTHCLVHSLEAPWTAEDNEAIQQGLATGNIFQSQFWDAKGKL